MLLGNSWVARNWHHDHMYNSSHENDDGHLAMDVLPFYDLVVCHLRPWTPKPQGVASSFYTLLSSSQGCIFSEICPHNHSWMAIKTWRHIRCHINIQIIYEIFITFIALYHGNGVVSNEYLREIDGGVGDVACAASVLMAVRSLYLLQWIHINNCYTLVNQDPK